MLNFWLFLGSIHSTISSLTGLQELFLGTNSLTGKLYGDRKLATRIDIYRKFILLLFSDFSSIEIAFYVPGTIPMAIGFLTGLTDLSLSSNSLTGELHGWGDIKFSKTWINFDWNPYLNPYLNKYSRNYSLEDRIIARVAVFVPFYKFIDRWAAGKFGSSCKHFIVVILPNNELGFHFHSNVSRDGAWIPRVDDG